MSQDPEKNQEKTFYVPGFGAFSDLIASDEDHTSAIYKRFDKLVVRDLLYYQSELAQLHAEQDRYDKEDSHALWTASPELAEAIHASAQDYSKLEVLAKKDHPDGRWSIRLELAIRIRRTLKDYRKAVLLDAQIRALGAPDERSMNALAKAFHKGEHPVLAGAGTNLYPLQRPRPSAVDNDYVTASSAAEDDLLTTFLKHIWSRFFGSRPIQSGIVNHASHPQMSYYSLEVVTATAKFISTFLAAALLLAPMLSLYQVSKDKPATTMGLIVLFTTLFTATLALVTNARRGEIFGATAAYAAVLVVFVSGDFANGKH